jgi:dTDP-4-amino-4,6-dideoxygalactose transaminase
MEDKLALHGGPKTVTLERNDPWPVISEEEIQAVVQLMRSGKISIGDGSGPIGEFEDAFAAYVGAKYALMHNNGTSSLHAGFFAVGVGPGDEVIVPSYTWHATAGGVVTANAIPIFCESDPRTLNIDPADVARKVTPRTKAIAVVHLWGNIADMDGVMAVARKHNLKVVEDCSHAHGGTWRGKPVGAIGDVGCFSLQGSKVLVAGEGGILVTNDPQVYDRALLLGHFGRIDRDAVLEADRAYNTGFGVKYRAHPLAAAMSLGELKHLDEYNKLRAENYEYLMDGLRELPGIRVTETLPGAVRGGYYGTRILYDREKLLDIPKDTFMNALKAEGVQCDFERYPLLHLTPFYGNRQLAYENFVGSRLSTAAPLPPYKSGDLPVSEDFHARLIALPVFTKPQKTLLDQYIESFRKTIRHIEDLK